MTVASAVKDLKVKGASAYVWDLRSPGAALLRGGVETAALFVYSNLPVVFVVYKSGVVDAQATLATGMDITTPLVVLVDANTASAAEVCTAAYKKMVVL